MVNKFYCLLSMALTLFLCGCAQKTIQAVGTPSPLARELSSKLWLRSGQTFRFRFSGNFQIDGKEMDFTCFMVLDTASHLIRMAVLGPFDVQLFTLSVDLKTHKALSGMSQVMERKVFIGAMAQVVRKIFLSPLPSVADLVSRQDKYVVLEKATEDSLLRYWFNKDERLKRTEALGNNKWKIRYDRWEQCGKWSIPWEYRYEDKRGLELKLELDEVKL